METGTAGVTGKHVSPRGTRGLGSMTQSVLISWVTFSKIGGFDGTYQELSGQVGTGGETSGWSSREPHAQRVGQTTYEDAWSSREAAPER